MRGGLLIFGIVIVVLAYAASSYFTAQQQALLSVVGSGCNSVLGTLGSALSATIANDCQKVNAINTILAIVPVAYLVGGIFFFLGLVIPGSRPVQEIRQPVVKEETEQKTEEDAVKTLKLRYAKGEITKKQYDEMKKDLAD